MKEIPIKHADSYSWQCFSLILRWCRCDCGTGQGLPEETRGFHRGDFNLKASLNLDKLLKDNVDLGHSRHHFNVEHEKLVKVLRKTSSAEISMFVFQVSYVFFFAAAYEQ